MTDIADGGTDARERVLPTGLMHIAMRLSGAPLMLVSDSGAVREAAGMGLVGGARTTSYMRVLSPGRSVGVQLQAGAATLLFGVPAHELAERHTSLDEVWGPAATELRQRLATIDDPDALLVTLEQFLLARLPRVRGIDPAIALALDLFRRSEPVAAVVDRIGWSHRRFIDRFQATVGMSPKRFCRVRRLSRVIHLAARRPAASLAELALDAGYSDQPHFTREFREISGMTPGEYRAAKPATPHHVPIPRGSVNFVQDVLEADAYRPGSR